MFRSGVLGWILRRPTISVRPHACFCQALAVGGVDLFPALSRLPLLASGGHSASKSRGCPCLRAGKLSVHLTPRLKATTGLRLSLRGGCTGRRWADSTACRTRRRRDGSRSSCYTTRPLSPQLEDRVVARKETAPRLAGPPPSCTQELDLLHFAPPAPRAPSCALIAEVAVAAAAANEPFGSTKPRRSHPALLWSSHSTSRSHFLRMGPRSQTRWRSGFRRRQTACRICKDGRVTAAALDAGPPDLALVLSPPLVVEVLERRGQQ